MSLKKYAQFVYHFARSVFVNLCILCRGIIKVNANRVEFTDDEIAIQARYICQKYIEQKFAEDVYKSVFETPANDGICSEDVVKTMNKFGRILEKGYPNLYTDVVRQLNFRINFEIVICGLFTSVSDNILMGGITWAKIVSMHAFAGALAKDCCQAKDIKTARNISKWMGQYTRKRLSGWIRRHGGWVSLLTT